MRHRRVRDILAMGLWLALVLASPRAIALDPNAGLHHYNCHTWTRYNGLPANCVYSIAQTRDGYLWLGTSLGLMRFDGVEFQVIGVPASSDVHSTRITCMAPDPKGGLWFGMENSAFGRYGADGSWWLGKNPHGLSSWSVKGLQAGSDGTVWVGGDFTARLAGGTTNLEFWLSAETNSPLVNAVFEDSKGRIWMGTAGRGIYYWEKGRINKLADPAAESRIVNAIAEDKQGRIWMGTQVGVLCYGPGLKPETVSLPQNEIRCLLVDHHGILWAGTADEGIFRYKDGEYSPFREIDGLADDSILSMAEDSEGSLWIGTREGMTQLSDVKFTTYSRSDGIPVESILSVSASPRGGVWLGTGVGPVYLDHGQARVYSAEAGLETVYTKRVFEARNGDVYVLSGGNEVKILSGGRVVARVRTPDMAVALVEDSKGVVVSCGGELYRVNRGGLSPYTFVDGKKPELYWVVNMAPGRDGSIWVASVNGICRIQHGRFKQWTQWDGLADSNTRWVCEGADGTVWVGMSTGIACLRGGRIDNLLRQDGLPDPNILSLVPDDSGRLWAYTLRGLFKLEISNVMAFFDGRADHVDCMMYDGPEGYSQEPSGCRTADGRIWFPGSKGALMVDPAHVPINRTIPPVHISRIRTGAKELNRSKPIVLGPRTRELEFSYTANSFISPQGIQFRYMLERFDHEWIRAGERRMAFYANLPPGQYTFRVAACNADGIWNETGDAVNVKLLPAFYQTFWFRALAAVFAIASLVGGYRWRLRHLTRKQVRLQQNQALLERRVDERTTELATANDSLRKEIAERTRIQTELESQKSELVSEIEERKRIQAEMDRVHMQLLDASRRAGQAEVASGVLHNVGNTLNSVNVSASLVSDRLAKLRVDRIADAARILRKQCNASPALLSGDPQAQKLPDYFERLATLLGQEQRELLAEMNALGENLEHIKQVVSMQENYTNDTTIIERVSVAELVDSALKIDAGSYERHSISVERQFETDASVQVDRHKVTRILLNLVQNARNACAESSRPDRKVTVRIEEHESAFLRIAVSDNGVGIPSENLTRIFGQDFIYRKSRQGYGLHEAALVAKGLGGTLTAHSEGLGQGATFTLDLPRVPRAKGLVRAIEPQNTQPRIKTSPSDKATLGDLGTKSSSA